MSAGLLGPQPHVPTQLGTGVLEGRDGCGVEEDEAEWAPRADGRGVAWGAPNPRQRHPVRIPLSFFAATNELGKMYTFWKF